MVKKPRLTARLLALFMDVNHYKKDSKPKISFQKEMINGRCQNWVEKQFSSKMKIVGNQNKNKRLAVMTMCSWHFDNTGCTCSSWITQNRLLSLAAPLKKLLRKSFRWKVLHEEKNYLHGTFTKKREQLLFLIPLAITKELYIYLINHIKLIH